MSTPNVDPGAAALIDELREQLERQPWYAKASNTVSTAVGVILLAIWMATSAGLEISADITRVVGVIIGVATVLFVRKTPNGVTETEVQRLEALAPYVGKHRRED